MEDSLTLIEGGSSHLVPVQMSASPRYLCCGLPIPGTDKIVGEADEGTCSIRVYAEIDTDGKPLFSLILNFI